MGKFPTPLLTHTVTVRQRVTTITDGEPVESVTTIGTAACLISSVQVNRGVNDQDGALGLSATLSGVDPLLGQGNVLFVVVAGPFDAGTVLFPAGGWSPHGAAGGVSRFYRFAVSTVKPG